MKIQFIYSTAERKIECEKLVTKVVLALVEHLELPAHIEVEFKQMGPSAYGETILDPRYTKRILLNSSLSPKDLFYPVVHEMIHVNQIFKGQLTVSRTGVYVWEGKTYIVHPDEISYPDYLALPWEADVTHRQKSLVKKILGIQTS